MTTRRNAHLPRKMTRAATALIIAAAMTACTSSGGSESTGTTGPKSSGSGATTSTQNRPTDTTDTTDTTETTETTATDGDRGEWSVADLETVLPEADEVGMGFVEVQADDEESSEPALEAALLDACPDAAQFLDSNGDDVPKAERDFEADDGRTFSVSLNPSPRNFDEETFPKVVDAMNSCGTVSYTASNGAEVELTLSAERIDDLGDRGVLLQMDITLDHPSLSGPVSFTQGGWIFLQSGVSVSVNTADGIGNDSTVTPADFESVGDVALQLSNDLHQLTDS